jgi:hypothetical protein
MICTIVAQNMPTMTTKMPAIDLKLCSSLQGKPCIFENLWKMESELTLYPNYLVLQLGGK